MLLSHEVDFLGHHISICGIEPDWPVPKSSTEVHAFLGLMCYIADFLPLLDNTLILTPLTHKSVNSTFLQWSTAHQQAFDVIKSLVLSFDCLTCIDHDNMGKNHIFFTCDSSDWCTRAVFSYGLTWKTAHPIAFNSTALKAAQLNCLVYEKGTFGHNLCTPKMVL
jgi:hypothetical protein